MATIGIEHEVELISTNVVDLTSSNYICVISGDGLYRGNIGDPVRVTKIANGTTGTWYGVHLTIPSSNLEKMSFSLKTISGQEPTSAKILKGVTDWNPANYPVTIPLDSLKNGTVNLKTLIDDSAYATEYSSLTSVTILVAYSNTDGVENVTSVWEFLPFNHLTDKRCNDVSTIRSDVSHNFGALGNIIAQNSDYIYQITNIEDTLVINSKYKYRLYEGDVIIRDNRWFKVLKDINLSYGEAEDNGVYNVSVIGLCPSENWTTTKVVDTINSDGDVVQVVKTIYYNKFCKAVVSGEKLNVVEIVQNNENGAYVDVNERVIGTYDAPFKVFDTIPKAGSKFKAVVGSAIEDITVTTPPSLPDLDSEYYEEIQKCEADKLYRVLELQPFDKLSTSYATADNIMTYVVKTTNKFNSFTLAGVTATQLTYKVKNTVGTIVEEATVAVDCYLDDAHLLGQTTTTLFLQFDELYDVGYTIEIELRNSGEVKLGAFFTNIAIDEGMTQFNIQPSIRDYNNYTPDTWGQIPEAVKSKVKQCKVEVVLPFSTFDRSYQRHKFLQGKFATIDVTDSKVKNKYTLTSLVMRGILLEVSPAIIVKSNSIDDYYKYSLIFLEVV